MLSKLQVKGSITVTFTGLLMTMMLITSFLILMFRISLISAQIQTNLDTLALSALKNYSASGNYCAQIQNTFNEVQSIDFKLTVCEFKDNVLTLSAQQTLNFWTISKTTKAGYKNCEN